MGLQHTCGIQVTWRTLHILLSAVNFNQKYDSTQYLQPNIIQPADTWLSDEHIELLCLMVDNDKLVLPSHANVTFKKMQYAWASSSIQNFKKTKPKLWNGYK